jgi:hypothetical protein
VSDFLFSSPSKNFDIAYIIRSGENYKVTIKGERSLMSHDLISAFSRKTYTDSIVLVLPRSEGEILGHEIPKKGSYDFSGSIKVKNHTMMVDLYQDKLDQNLKDPLTWNGEYKLKWIEE